MAASPTHAMYMRPDLEEVPIGRLIDNLTEQVKAQPKNADLLFNLARVHAMAYASKSDKVQVWRGREARGPWFGYEPRYVPYQVKTTEDRARIEEAQRHLQTAISMHQKVVELKPDHLAARLGHGWCLQQVGKKDEAVAALRKTIEMAWEKDKDLQLGGLGGHYITAEAADYLIPLLDSQKDAKEIATLRDRSRKLRSLPRPITPIAIPLRDGLTAEDIVDAEAAVAFDADGSGLLRRWTWINADAGWLVIDHSGRGQVRSALQMFGGVSFWCFWDNGYTALAALDDNGDRHLSGEELRGLAVWHDANGNGISEADEVRALAAWGIVAVACDYGIDADHPDKIAFSRRGVTFRDGNTRPTFDVILHPQP